MKGWELDALQTLYVELVAQQVPFAYCMGQQGDFAGEQASCVFLTSLPEMHHILV